MGYTLTANERETIIRTDEGDRWVWITTYHPPTCRKLREDPRFTVYKDGGDQVFAKLPKSEWNPLGFAKHKRNMTPEQKAEAAARMQKARAAT